MTTQNMKDFKEIIEKMEKYSRRFKKRKEYFAQMNLMLADAFDLFDDTRIEGNYKCDEYGNFFDEEFGNLSGRLFIIHERLDEIKDFGTCYECGLFTSVWKGATLDYEYVNPRDTMTVLVCPKCSGWFKRHCAKNSA